MVSLLGVLILLAVVGGGVFVAYTGWAPLLGERSTPVHDENFHEPVTGAEFFPDGSAEDNLPFFTETLQDYVAGDSAIEGRPVVEAVVDAGFDRSAMEVSFDRTQTNLVADNIFVAVRIDESCLIGQLTTSKREAFAAVEPAVGPDQDLCLIGKTRPIDW